MATAWVVIGAAALVLAIAAIAVWLRRRQRRSRPQTPRLTWREKRAKRREELWGPGGLADQAGGLEMGCAGAYDTPHSENLLAVTDMDDAKLRKWL